MSALQYIPVFQHGVMGNMPVPVCAPWQVTVSSSEDLGFFCVSFCSRWNATGTLRCRSVAYVAGWTDNGGRLHIRCVVHGSRAAVRVAGIGPRPPGM